MTVADLLTELQQRGVQVRISGGKLILSGQDNNPIEPSLLEQVVQLKSEIIRQNAPPVFLTVQFTSACNRQQVGKKYAEDPATEILSCLAEIDGKYVVWLPRVEHNHLAHNQPLSGLTSDGETGIQIALSIGAAFPQDLHEVIETGRYFCVHSAHRSTEETWLAKGWPQPAGWINTHHLARAGNLPDDLNRLGEILGYDENSVAIYAAQLDQLLESMGLVLIYRGQIPGDELQKLSLLRYVYHRLLPYGELDVIESDWKINHRGIGLDLSLARNLLNLHHADERRISSELSSATNGAVSITDLKRHEWLSEWIKSQGVSLPDLKRHTLETALRGQHTGGNAVSSAVLAVLNAKLQQSRNNGARLSKLLESAGPDGRVCDLYEYQKCITGRWAGRGVQPQNLPKPHASIRELASLIESSSDYDRFVAALPEGVITGDGISSLMRSCFVPASGYLYCIADFASIEARGLAWCAGEEQLLRLFSEGVDVYCELASNLFNYQVTRLNQRERNIGKIAVLGCGYGMSGHCFADYARRSGVDLSSAQITAEQIVQWFRNTFPLITGGGRSRAAHGLWQQVAETVRYCMTSRGQSRQAAKCLFYYDGHDLYLTLPSTRKMVYRNITLVDGPAPAESLIQYLSPAGKTQNLYGAKLVENIVQAVCRDILAYAITKCESENLAVVLHVHDEIVVEIPENNAESALMRLLTLISTPPAWATGFPLEVEGGITPRYAKPALLSSVEKTARNGIVLN